MTESAGVTESVDAERLALLELIVRSTRDAVLAADTSGRIFFFNAAAEAIYGYTSDEIVGQSLALLGAETGRSDQTAVFQQVLTGNDVGPFETLRRRKNGTLVEIEMMVTPLVDAKGVVVGAVSVHREISERKQAQRRLLESETRYRMIAEGTADVVMHSVEGVIEWTSPNVREVLGWTPDELEGRSTLPFWHPNDQAHAIEMRGRAYAGGRERARMRFRTKAGEYRWIDVSVKPTAEPGGGTGMIAVLRDVSNEVAADAALADSEARYRMIIEGVADVVWHSSHGSLQWVSPNVEAVFGWSPDELIGFPTVQLWHPHDRERAIELWDRTYAGHEGEARLRFRTKRGDYRWVDVACRPVTETGGDVGMIVTSRDVSAEVLATTALTDSELRFRSAMEHAAVGMCICDLGGNFLQVNPALCEFFGHSESALLRSTWKELTHPDDLSEDQALADRVAAGEIPSYRLRRRFIAADGALLWGDLVVAGIPDASGMVTQFVAQVHDITRQVTIEHELSETVSLLSTVLDNSEDGTLQFDTDLRVRYVNDKVVERSGIPFERWIGSTFTDVGFSPERSARHEANIRRVFSTGRPMSYQFDIVEPRGHHYYEASIAPVISADGTVTSVIETARDVTERVQNELELASMATHDSLTGLANRVELNDDITRALASARRSGLAVAVLLMDLDGFKFVNDSLGHAVGDELIKAAAGRLASVVRSEDLVVRSGGDEFVVVMRDLADSEDAFRCAWRIVESFRTPFRAAEAELYSTASVGIAFSTPESLPDDLMREADIAMYRAKGEGGDRMAVFNEELRDTVFRRVEVERELRSALDQAQIEVWFQPEIDLQSGRVVGAEALARWRHPSGELWTADRFIDVAEETGLILPIGNWVVREACTVAATWNAAQPDAPMVLRVNLSALQLSDERCLDVIDDALCASGLDPHMMCAEITETAFLRRSKVVQENLAGIHERGIQVASDDFGTGYASLAQLRDHPVDVIKIDHSFIADLVADDRSRRLVAGTIALAHRLGMSVTAEGVEESTQEAMLRALGCDAAQGFLYARALPAAELDEFVARANTS